MLSLLGGSRCHMTFWQVVVVGGRGFVLAGLHPVFPLLFGAARGAVVGVSRIARLQLVVRGAVVVMFPDGPAHVAHVPVATGRGFVWFLLHVGSPIVLTRFSSTLPAVTGPIAVIRLRTAVRVTSRHLRVPPTSHRLRSSHRTMTSFWSRAYIETIRAGNVWSMPPVSPLCSRPIMDSLLSVAMTRRPRQFNSLIPASPR